MTAPGNPPTLRDKSAETLARFFELIYAPNGLRCLFTLPDRCHFWFQNSAELAAAALALDAKGLAVFHGCATFTVKTRKQEHVAALQILWQDIDAGPGKPYFDAAAAYRAFEEWRQRVGLPPALIVASGGGLHVYWPLCEPLSRERWRVAADRLRLLAEQHGLQIDAGSTIDAARILRPPGTHNRKQFDQDGCKVVANVGGEPRPVRAGPLVGPYTLKELGQLFEDAPGTLTGDPLGAVPHYLRGEKGDAGLFNIGGDERPSDAGAIAAECAQVRRLRDAHGQLPEPEWYAVLGVLAYCDDSGRILAHEWSSGDPRYRSEDTARKLDQYVKHTSGPTTCAHFDRLVPGVCTACKHRAVITTPAQLGRDRPQRDADRRKPMIADTDVERSGLMLDSDDLCRLLDVHAWAALDTAPEAKLLGDLITPSSRGFLVGRTGLGKTLIAYALAGGMASGKGFLHWRCDRPSKWLIIDGEMPTALIKKRAEEMIRRAGDIPPGGLTIYSLDRAEEFARRFPALGSLEPINTAKGQEFVLALAETLHVDGIIFDNVMSLVSGDQKDEEPWSQTLPLVTALSKRRIAQVYLDHTGHNTDRQYGSSTKAWRFDTVGIMTPLPDSQRQRHEIAFTLSFEPPGKTRRRTPANWQDFETVTIRLSGDRWTFEPGGKPLAKLSPAGQLWHKALRDVIAMGRTPGCTTKTEWFAEAARTGLVEAITVDDKKRSSKLALQRKYAIELRKAGLIAIHDETVTELGPQSFKVAS
jgi:hypothetical protein